MSEWAKHGQHKKGCKALCQECGEDKTSGCHREGWVPGSGVYWHDFVPRGESCDCMSEKEIATVPENVVSAQKYHSHVPGCPKRGYRAYYAHLLCACKPTQELTDSGGNVIGKVDEDGVVTLD